jgi:serine protease Do
LTGEVVLAALRNGEGEKPLQFPQAVPPAPIHFLEGVTLGDLGTRLRRQLSIPGEMEGALITALAPSSPTYVAGLRPGSVILEINREAVRSAEEATMLGRGVPSGPVLLRVWTEEGAIYVMVNPLH